MSTFFSVENIAFTWLDYQISWLELVGTIFNLAAVILAARKNIWTWPTGIVGVTLFGFLFYQINLYADMLEQLYYLITGFTGWYLWTRVGTRAKEIPITTLTAKQLIAWLAGIMITGLSLGAAMTQIHLWLPTFFPEPADLPYLDSVTTMTAFAAQFLMMQRKLESSYLWLVLDVIAVGLYWYKDVPFVALLYFLFLINAVYGLKNWLPGKTAVQCAS